MESGLIKTTEKLLKQKNEIEEKKKIKKREVK